MIPWGSLHLSLPPTTRSQLVSCVVLLLCLFCFLLPLPSLDKRDDLARYRGTHLSSRRQLPVVRNIKPEPATTRHTDAPRKNKDTDRRDAHRRPMQTQRALRETSRLLMKGGAQTNMTGCVHAALLNSRAECVPRERRSRTRKNGGGTR